MMLRFRKGSEERVKMGSAHDDRRTRIDRDSSIKVGRASA